jgi:AraC-like DNA-binding protein
MPGSSSQTRVLTHSSPLGSWELAVRAPAPALAGYVTVYQGYVETAAEHSIRRREMPWPGVVLIMNFGPPFRLRDPRRATGPVDYRSFVAGLYDSYVLAESTGLSRCVQVNFTPLGAYRFFRLPMDAIANLTFHFEDLFGSAARRMVAQLEETPSWDARFALLDTLIATRITGGHAPLPQVVWAWHRLQDPSGPRAVGAIAAEVGWSRKHLIARFREQIGLPPKTVARILRFHQLVRCLDGLEQVRWAELANRAGYYDQAHLNRDFRELAGSTPGDFLRRRVPDGGVMDADE